MSEYLIVKGIPEHTFNEIKQEFGKALQITIGNKFIQLDNWQVNEFIATLAEHFPAAFQVIAVNDLCDKVTQLYEPALKSMIRNMLYPPKIQMATFVAHSPIPPIKKDQL